VYGVLVALSIVVMAVSAAHRRRLARGYSVTLATATGGRFDIPDASAPSGWRTEQRFELGEIRGPSGGR